MVPARVAPGAVCSEAARRIGAVARPSRFSRAGPAVQRAGRRHWRARRQPCEGACRDVCSRVAARTRDDVALRGTPNDGDGGDADVGFASISEALADVAAGKFVVVLDDEDRENEGDLIIAAEHATTESIAFMVNETSGLLCVGMTGEDLDRLELPLMVTSKENDESMYTAFTVSVDLREGTHTGISAQDRGATLRALADPAMRPHDFRRPGHIFPLRAQSAGVLCRPGHTEAAVDLARLADCAPAGVLCEIVNRADGSMQTTPQLLRFSRDNGLKCITIRDLIHYRLQHEQLVEVAAPPRDIATPHGPFTAHTFRTVYDDREHVALVRGDVAAHGSDLLVAAHEEDVVGDVFEAAAGSEVFASMERIASEGRGVLVYSRSQRQPSAAEQQFPGAAVALVARHLGVKSARVLVRSAARYAALSGLGVQLLGRETPST